MRASVFQLTLVILLSSSIATGEHGASDPWTAIVVPEPPEGEWYVLDMAGVISEQTEADYERELSRITEESGVLVRLVTITSMEQATNGVCSTTTLYNFCYDEDYFSDDGGYARHMFGHFGMEDGGQPSMLMALSTEDRQFKFVMPELSVTIQKASQGVFESGSARLSIAADFYEYETGEIWDWHEWSREELCIWEGNQEWVDEYQESDRWHCGYDFGGDGGIDEWNNWWYLCEAHDDQWWCSDEYGQDPAHEGSANGSLMPPLPDQEATDFSRGNPWEEALSFYVYESGTLLSIEPWALQVHLAVYAIGALGLVTLLGTVGREILGGDGIRATKTGYDVAKKRLVYAYARTRADKTLKTLNGDEGGTVFETVADQIESLSAELRKDPDEVLRRILSADDDYELDRDLRYEPVLEKTCVELNKRADDAGVSEHVTIPDIDMSWEIGKIRVVGDKRDRVNRVAIPCALAGLASCMYLGFALIAGGPLSLGAWVLESPGYLVGPSGSEGIFAMLLPFTLFIALAQGLMDYDALVRAIAPPRNPLLPFRRPSPKLQAADAHNVVVPASVATAFVSSGYVVSSAGFDEHGNEIYETQRSVSSSGGDSGGGGGCGGGGCGGGGCGGGGGF